MSVVGQYFWFLVFGVWLVNIAIWRRRLRKLVALGRLAEDDAESFLRTLAYGVGAPCIALGVVALLGRYAWPTCAGLLEFRDAPSAATSSITLVLWLAILAWLWVGRGAEQLGRIGPVLLSVPDWKRQYSARTVRMVATAVMLLAALGAASTRGSISRSECAAQGQLPN